MAIFIALAFILLSIQEKFAGNQPDDCGPGNPLGEEFST
jgi:hypothetical protein